MSSSIAGSLGGSLASGAQVQCLNVLTNVITFSVGDASGNYSIASLLAGTYVIRAFLSGYVYYHPQQVIADGATAYININLNPTALSASNSTQDEGGI